jgi:hypothetical protein
MTVFGNRDFAPTDPPHEAPRAEAALAVAALPPIVALPVADETRRVVIRVRGGEEIEVGRAHGREPAVRIARDTIRMIEDAQASEEWPAVGDRFLRPDAIVSIDVQRAEP